MTLRVREILDTQIVDRNGKPLGKVSDLILDLTVPGAACYVLVTLPPEARDGKEKTVALPWSLIARADASGEGVDRYLMVDVAAATLGRLRNLADA